MCTNMLFLKYFVSIYFPWQALKQSQARCKQKTNNNKFFISLFCRQNVVEIYLLGVGDWIDTVSTKLDRWIGAVPTKLGRRIGAVPTKLDRWIGAVLTKLDRWKIKV